MSSYGLSSETKKQVKSTVLALRALLEGKFDPDTGDPIPPGGDVARQIARYGILVNKPESLKSENAPEYLTDEEKKKRERICAAIKREVAIFGKLSDKAALRRAMRAFIRQTSYTWINRLLGLRCMEARGLLRDDRGELDFVVTPSDDHGGLPRRAWQIKGEDPGRWQTAKLYDLQCEVIADACRQLTQEIKVLFDPEHDYGLIWPSPPALNTLLQKIQELDKIATPSPFTSPDFLGWVYQYFQIIEKDLVFQAASKKKKKIEKDDIIAATQIYTEHYMVEYLVQNTLGRFWMEMHPDSELSTKWAYYVKPPEENPPVERELKKAINIKLMDPALGSGHFHLVAFDLLLDMYAEEIENAGQLGWPDTPSVADKKDIPVAILEHNLFGIDIDARSIQLASLVLVMKARESGYERPISHLNLVVANSAPFESEAWYQFIQSLEKEGKHSVARVLAALGTKLMNLDEFGSLLRIEDEIQKIIHQEKNKWIEQAKAGMEQEYLFPEMTKPRQEKLPFETAITDETFFDRLGSVIQKELDTFYLKARQDGLAEEAIMAADAERGFDFVRLSIRRYDVVYTNPPYMGSKNMGDRLKKFVEKAYPQGRKDLYAAFVLRCRELSKQYGYVGMVTQQSWMFLRTFVNLRALPEEKLKKAKGSFTGLLRVAMIQTLAHLGPSAFSEISGEVVNTVLLTFCNALPTSKHRFTAFRLVAAKGPKEKNSLLLAANTTYTSSLTSRPLQFRFHGIPQSPVCYWLGEYFFDLLGWRNLGKAGEVKQGLATADDPQFVRFSWEVPYRSKRWLPYYKGGGYKKWDGFALYCVEWDDDGRRIKNRIDPKTQRPYSNVWMLDRAEQDLFFRKGLTSSLMAQGSFAVRFMEEGGIFSSASPCFFASDKEIKLISSCVNCRVISFLLRALSPELKFRESYVARIPLPNSLPNILVAFADTCLAYKKWLLALDPIERTFGEKIKTTGGPFQDWLDTKGSSALAVAAVLHTIESVNEQEVFALYEVEGENLQAVLNETGIPSGWHPLISGYDSIPPIPAKMPRIPKRVIDELAAHDRLYPTSDELNMTKSRLQKFYSAGAGSKVEKENETPQDENETENADVVLGSRIPIPTETFIEELSQKLEIHPISIYWLLGELHKEEGLVCPSMQKRDAEDYVSVMILRMLSYQWPKQVEADEPLPDWADDDGIIPLTDGLGEATLLDRIRKRFGADFGEEKESSIESEFSNIVGKPLERWLEEDFFARHVKQFKKRPIAWHIVSDSSVVNHEAGQSGKGKKKVARKKQKPAFSVMVHYHRLVDGDKGYRKLLLLKNKYLEKLMSQTRSELESLRGKGDDPKTFDRIAELDRKLVELEDFRERLERIQEGKDSESSLYVRWKSAEEQPQGWRPDINDGVKINIAPWERLGMFPIKKIVGKVEMTPD